MKTLLETERLILIPIDAEIIDALLESNDCFNHVSGLINDAGEYLNPHPQYLLKIRDRLLAHPEEYPLAVDQLIVIRDTRTVIGTIYFKSLPLNGVSEIGYGMNPVYWGKGYMSEALKAMLRYGGENGISEVIADTTMDNIRSQNVLKRNGFVLKEEKDGKLIFIRDNT
ncbi:MAG: GNAT family N-acetyltransferase [Erysipelotrichaceae bacterium]|nr:GNAT family N-acetyltransferase [Erysipelotrichaceae bacterium]